MKPPLPSSPQRCAGEVEEGGRPRPSWEATLGPLLRARDPAAARADLLADPDLPEELRHALSNLDPAGLRILGLLVARLRFNRLLQRSAEHRARYAADPEGWAREFQEWHEATPAEPEGEEGP